MLVSLDDIKKHLNIPDSFEDDDEYLTSLEELAEELIAIMIDTKSIDTSATNWDLESYFTEDVSTGPVVPRCIQHAIKIIVTDYYTNRTSISTVSLHDVPRSAVHLVNQYKNYGI